jgi:hypothetical protein
VTTTVLAKPFYLTLEAFARASGLHPELVTQLLRLGLIEADYDSAGRPYLEPSQLARVARIQRLRAGLSINYAAVGLVLDLLDRIDTLETELRSRPEIRRSENRRPENPGGANPRWIRTV